METEIRLDSQKTIYDLFHQFRNNHVGYQKYLKFMVLCSFFLTLKSVLPDFFHSFVYAIKNHFQCI
jgi:hypothetical protein